MRRSRRLPGRPGAWLVAAGSLAAGTLAVGGCATPYVAVPYVADAARYDGIRITAAKTVYQFPTIDSLDAAAQKQHHKRFTPGPYLTDAVTQELAVLGVAARPAPFEAGPGLDGVQIAIRNHVPKDPDAVFLATETTFLSPAKLTLDARVFSSEGDVLFEKRGLCASLRQPPPDQSLVVHNALRQVFLDAGFERALH